MYNNELQHFGIKGMKWGVRRYQNPDGTLTEAGKKRLSKTQKREKTPEEQARSAARKQKIVKAAKVTAAAAGIAASMAFGYNYLTASKAGLEITRLGGKALGQMFDSGMLSNKTMTKLTKELLAAEGTKSVMNTAAKTGNSMINRMKDSGFDDKTIALIVQAEIDRKK